MYMALIYGGENTKPRYRLPAASECSLHSGLQLTPAIFLPVIYLIITTVTEGE